VPSKGVHSNLLDAWIADGPGIRRRTRLFTAWLQRADVTGALHVDWPYDFPQRPPLQDEQRLAVLRRLPRRDLRRRRGDTQARRSIST
jgi:hypothetical protein